MANGQDTGIEGIVDLRLTLTRQNADYGIQLQRNFKFFSIFGYSVILGATWEFALVLVPLWVERDEPEWRD